MGGLLISGLILSVLCIPSRSYEVRCPTVSEWKFRAEVAGVDCSNMGNELYTCLWQKEQKKYLEYCGGEEVVKLGFYYVLVPNPQPAACPNPFYQPFKFTSVGNSQCVYKKSICTDEGQVVAKEGTNTTDRRCRCDYTKGYVFVLRPRDGCTCIPSEEDCSCVHRPCNDPNDIMQKDYKCYNKDAVILPEKIPCERILYQGSANDKVEQPVKIDNLSKGYQVRRIDSAIIKAFCIILIVLILLLTISLLYVVPVITETTVNCDLKMMGKNPQKNEYTVIYGDIIHIQKNFKSSFGMKSVVWEKNGKLLEEKNVDTKSTTTYSELQITKFSSDDSGEYLCFVTNNLKLSNFSLTECFSFIRGIPFASYFPAFQSFHQNHITIRCFDVRLEKNCTVMKKGNASLAASVGDPGVVHSVIWIKYNESGIPTKVDIENKNDKYGKISTLEPSLKIKNCNPSDAGTYLCVQIDRNNQFLKDLCNKWILKITEQEEYKEIQDHRNNELYVKTVAVDNVMKQLEEIDLVLITGREGTGKTTLCLEIASLYDHRGFLPFKITTLNRDKICNLNEPKVLFLIDSGFNANFIRQLITEIKEKFNAKGFKILLTCRKQILNEIKDILKDNYTVFDLDTPLTRQEKEIIFQIYTDNWKKMKPEKGKILDECLDKEAKEAIVQSEPWMGFPLTIKDFCDESERLKEKENYFIDPPASVINDLREMFEKGLQESQKESKEKVPQTDQKEVPHEGQKESKEKGLQEDQQKTMDILQQNQKETIIMLTVLLYIFKHEKHELCLSEFDEKLFANLRLSHFQIKMTSLEIGQLKNPVKQAADKLVNTYLTVTGDVYTFINPCLFKAMTLSHKIPFSNLIEHGSLKDIMDIVNYEIFHKFLSQKKETLDGETWYNALVKKFINSALRNQMYTRNIGKYIYNNWIRNNDPMFRNELIRYLNDVFIPDDNDSSNKSFEEEIMKIDRSFEIEEKLESPWNVILLLEEITCHGRDPWIYTDNPSDFMIIFGLITATKGHYKETRNDTFELLLVELEKKLNSSDEKKLLEITSLSLDEKGNTFFHYLCLFNSDDSCGILDKDGWLSSKEKCKKVENQLLSKSNREKFGKNNSEGISPLELAAFLGKYPVFKAFLLGTEESKIEKQRKTFLQIAKMGKEKYYYSGKKVVEKQKHQTNKTRKRILLESQKGGVAENFKFSKGIEDIFDSAIVNSVTFGKEKEYEGMLSDLSTEVKKDKLRQPFQT